MNEFTIGKYTIKVPKKFFKLYVKDEKVNVEDMDIFQNHIDAFAIISNNGILTPMIDLNSHFDVFIILTMLKKYKLPERYFTQGFHNWTSSNDWIKLCNQEYLYLIYREFPDVVDFRKFFREYPRPYDSLQNALDLDIIKENPDIHIDLIGFYEEYNLKTIFDENTPETGKRYNDLWEQKKQYEDLFLVNPFNFSNYLKHTPTKDKFWSCKDITSRKIPVVGESSICSEKEFWERYDTFTCGILDTLPLKDCFVAGGSINLLLSNEYVETPSSDVDLYIPKVKDENDDALPGQVKIAKGKLENKKELFDEIIEKINTDHTYYAIRGCVVNVYVCGANRTIQLISADEPNLYFTLRRFDLTHIQLAVKYEKDNARKLLATPNALRALRERMSRFGWIGNLKPVRLVKAMYRGYDLHQDERVLEKHGQLVSFLKKDNPNIQKIIREFHGYFHPNAKDDENYILGMIERHTDASLVTSDIAYVRNNIIIGGKFKTDYEAMSYKNFNKNFIVNTHLPQRYGATPVKKENGFYRLMSGPMIVTNVIVSENGVEITSKLDDPDFITFIKKLETDVYNMYQQGEVTRNLIMEKDGIYTIKLVIANYIINSQEQRRYVCLRSQRGEPLNIKEDVSEGDEVKVIFYMNIKTDATDKAVELRPTRFIKFVDYSKSKEEDLSDNEEEIEDMKDAMKDFNIEAYQEQEFKD